LKLTDETVEFAEGEVILTWGGVVSVVIFTHQVSIEEVKFVLPE
jgi:hypothetical protein